jgi:type VI secretion system secreted protein VgrG
MPSPKSGAAASLTAPSVPKEATDADVADPGEASKIQGEEAKLNKGKLAEQKAPPFKPPSEDEPKDELTFIEIELVDDDGKPVANERYEITLPDKSVKSGTLDDKGFARVEEIKPGTCKVTFPERPGQVWE